MIPVLGISVWVIAKWFVVFSLLVYLVFAIVVVKQSQMMTQALEVELEKPIKVLSTLHLLFAAFVLLLAIVVL